MRIEEVKKIKKEHPELIEEVEGACRFCGQIAMVEAVFDWTQEEIDEVAVERCQCMQAAAYTAKKEQTESACKMIHRKFIEFKESKKVFLENTAKMVIDYEIAKANLSLTAEVKCTMSLDKDGKIRIKRTDTVSSEEKA